MNLLPRDLLLASQLEPQAVGALLRFYGFKDPERADANLQSMAEDPRARQILAQIADLLLQALAESADPDQSLDLFERLSKAVLSEVPFLSYLVNKPFTIELLARVLGASPFMAEILIRDPGLIYWISEPRMLDRPHDREETQRELDECLAPLRTHERRLDALRIFKRRELLHIGVRDILRFASVEETLSSLTVLADVLISAAYSFCARELLTQYFKPAPRLGLDPQAIEFAVIGLGKLGGYELNFSSDVDLMYVVGSDQGSPRLRKALTIPIPEFHRRLAQLLTTSLSDLTSEGYVHRVDLRLRPEGSAGSIVSSLPTCRRYYGSRAELWERMSFVKARVVTGDLSVGRRFMRIVHSFVYTDPLETGDMARVREIKKRIDREIAARGQIRSHVKLGLGGIREIEFIVQALQASHAGRRTRLRERGTIPALAALRRSQLLSQSDYHDLSSAYVFLRDVENKLQMVFDVQVHTLPTEPSAINACAMRLGYRDTEKGPAGELFMDEYRRYTENVHRIFERIFGEESGDSTQ